VRTLAVRDARVRALALTVDGKRLLWGGEGVPPQLVDPETGRTVLSMQRHTGFVTALAMTPDGTRAVSAGSDRVVRVWDLATGQCLHSLAGHREAVSCVAVSADSATAASGSLDGTVRLWDLEAGQRCARSRGIGERSAPCSSPDLQATSSRRARTARCTCGRLGPASRGRRSRGTCRR
jgi:WD40 repeat protein